MKHPTRRDRFRAFIASRRLLGLLGWYFALTIAVGLALGLAWHFAAGARSAAPLRDHVLPAFLALYGMQDPILAAPGRDFPEWLLVLLAVLALLLPALLLGAIVYKVLAPPGNLLVFRPKLELVAKEDRCHLVALFYIASRVKLRLLEFTAVVRTYEAAREDGREGEYPMKTFAVPTAWSRFHLPFAEVGSTMFVPVRMVAPTDPPGGPEEICLFRSEEGKLSVHSAGGMRIRPESGDFLDLFLIAHAKVPSLQSEHSEMVRFRLPDDLAEDLPPLPARFDAARYRFVTTPEAWARFEG